MNHPSDWQQREQGRDLGHSCIVQAPAGSGKTELLTQRMLGLLAQVENPEEVVAITFTRKAAAEMNHRLLGHLQTAYAQRENPCAEEKLPDHEQVSRDLALSVLTNDTRRGWNLLEQPGRLRIRTIDSLCSELARQLPVFSGLGGGHKVAINADALYRKAAALTLAHIEDSSDDLQVNLSRVLARYNNQYDGLVDLLTAMLADREQWIGHVLAARSNSGFDREKLEDALRFLVEKQLAGAHEILPADLLDELPRLYRYALENGPANEAQLEDLLQACGGHGCRSLDLPTQATALRHWNTVIDSLLTKSGNMRRQAPSTKEGFPAPSQANGEEAVRRKVFKDDFKELLDRHADNTVLVEKLRILRTLPDPGYQDEAWESLESLMYILLRAVVNWKLVMAQSGEVDFTEIVYRAIEALGSDDAPSELALRMDYRIQHLLLDEFQDTSYSQVRLLEQLTAGWADGDGRTLFLVGDPMQSIYRFRKAEVSLFIKAWRGQLFQHIQLRKLQLSVNFRSTQPVVDWVNRVFPAVMPKQDDPVMGAVSYTRASTRPGVSEQGEVTMQLLPERDDAEEARQVAEVIATHDSKERIAILVRSRSHASAILAEFDRLKIQQARYRYKAIDFVPLADTTLVKDLVSLTLALQQPADRLAWLALLRAPFIGLELADLDTLVAGNTKAVIIDTIATVLDEQRFDQFSDDAKQRLLRTGPILLEVYRQRGRQSVRTQAETAWVALGGPACLNHSGELEDAATYFKLLDSLVDQGLGCDRDNLDEALQMLYAQADSRANGNLQVLTIYSAKGLQFDTVIVPGLNRAPARDRQKLLHWFELAGEDRFVLSPMRNTEEKEIQKQSGDLIKFIASIEAQRQQLEDGRLTYVAATRAIRNLHLFGAIRPKKDQQLNPTSGTLLKVLWPAIEKEQGPCVLRSAERRLQQPAADQAGLQQTGPSLAQVWRRLAADWQSPTLPNAVSTGEAEHVDRQDYIEFNWAGEDARLAGNLVHRVLQFIGEKGLDSWQQNSGLDQTRNWCQQYLRRHGVQGDKLEAIIGTTYQALENCLASETGRWLLHDHQDARCEYELTAVLNGQARRMLLDRTFVSDGKRWIIDYKTSSHTGGDLDGFLQSETRRYRNQLRRYKDAMAITETRPIKTALYFPILDRLVEVSHGLDDQDANDPVVV